MTKHEILELAELIESYFSDNPDYVRPLALDFLVILIDGALKQSRTAANKRKRKAKA